jgi:hypothetical protein
MARILPLVPLFILLSGEQALVLMAPLPLALMLVQGASSLRGGPAPLGVA